MTGGVVYLSRSAPGRADGTKGFYKLPVRAVREGWIDGMSPENREKIVAQVIDIAQNGPNWCAKVQAFKALVTAGLADATIRKHEADIDRADRAEQSASLRALGATAEGRALLQQISAYLTRLDGPLPTAPGAEPPPHRAAEDPPQEGGQTPPPTTPSQNS